MESVTTFMLRNERWQETDMRWQREEHSRQREQHEKKPRGRKKEVKKKKAKGGWTTVGQKSEDMKLKGGQEP